MADKTGDPKIAARLRNLRVKRNLTQEQLAEKAGVSRATIRKIEIADRAIGKEAAPKIAAALNTTESFLIFGIEPKSESETKPKSRIPDLPPDDDNGEDGEEWVQRYVSDTGARVYFNKEYLRKLSPKTWRQIAAIIKEEISEDDEDQ